MAAQTVLSLHFIPLFFLLVAYNKEKNKKGKTKRQSRKKVEKKTARSTILPYSFVSFLSSQLCEVLYLFLNTRYEVC